ncbi:MAG: hypothetical protein M1834_002297, partial [Cirrosporium novae-zelandiae]
IANGDAAWEAAEKQVQKGANSTMVSVKSSKPAAKRKFGETAAEIYEKEVGGGKSERKAKKMKKGKR